VFKKYNIEYDLDDPRTTLAHRDIILHKPFLKKLYTKWYGEFMDAAHRAGKGKYLEIGSGGGFLKQVFPEVITTDILELPGVDMTVNAEHLPFDDGSLAAIMMLNVFHHIPRPYLFLREAERALRVNGRVIMIEPANTPLARFIYKRFHHEPFDENGPREIRAGNPLSHSNQALPYIYFQRDREWFEKEFPGLRVASIRYHTPLSYVVSGGVSRSAMLPGGLFPLVSAAEWLMKPLSGLSGLFCTIELVRV
jgi:SAM-dependent methyltransferase